MRNIQCLCDQRKATYHVVTISHNSSRPAFKSCLWRAVHVPATTLCTLCDAYLISSSSSPYPSRKGESNPILQTKQVRLREKLSDLPRVTRVAYVGAGLQAGWNFFFVCFSWFYCSFKKIKVHLLPIQVRMFVGSPTGHWCLTRCWISVALEKFNFQNQGYFAVLLEK